MKPRHTIALLSLSLAPALFAQEEPVVVPAPLTVEEPAKDPDEPMTVAEEMPEFPGGYEELLRYLGKRIKYPAQAMDSGIAGTVYVTFVVERDGSITGVKVLRGIGGGCDEEAVRLVSGMPNWTPGKHRGQPVRVQFNLPVRYALM